MPNKRISSGGIKIARPGHDVDTAGPENILFDSSFPAAKIRYTGVLTVGDYSGDMDDRYRRAIYTFPQSFAQLPMVFAASQNGDGSSDQGGFYLNAIPLSPGTARYLPLYTIDIYRDRFELYVLRYRISSSASWQGLPADNWKFWVLSHPVA